MEKSDWRLQVESFGPPAILVSIIAFMLWVRTRAVSQTITGEAVFFSGNDPWYHARIVQLIVRHFPATPGFDPWSYFPYGTARHSGFGGLFDQLIALAALILGGGNPNPHFIDVVTAYAPAVFGALAAIPAYLIATRLMDRWSGLLAAGLLALASGQFLSRTVVGAADHQSAETFFGAFAVLGFIYAIRTAYEEKPTTADVRDSNWIVLRRPVFAGLLGGVGIGSYLMMWPPGVMIVFTLGLFTLLQIIRDHLSNRSTEYLAFGVGISTGTAGILSLLHLHSMSINATAFSLLQPMVTFAVGGGAVSLSYVSHYMTLEGYERRHYPLVVVAIIIGTVAIASLVYPRSIDLLQTLVVRIYGFGELTAPSAGTVAEIRPATLEDAWRAFGPVFYVAVVGLLLVFVRVVRENRPVEFVVLLWSFTIFSAYFTMIRFGYYLAVNVAILAGFAIWWTSRHLLQLDIAVRDVRSIEPFQIIGILIILIAVVPGNVVAVGAREPVWEVSNRFGGTNQAWHNELTWVRGNTPQEPLDYSKLYSPPADGDFEYPEGAYGVMSWWDYGHWITVQGHRIPNANPFQQGPRTSSAYLQTDSETRGNLILEALPSLRERYTDIGELSNDELRSIIDSQSEELAGENTRYVMIDDQMAGGKFAAIATWTGPASKSGTSFQEVYMARQEFQVGDQRAQLIGMSDRYRNTMLARLYFGDARGLGHYRLVHETEQRSTFVSVAQRTPTGLQSTNIIHRRLSSQLFRAVQQRQDLAFYGVEQAARVKTFERVEGARIKGTANVSNETTVFATLRLRTNTGRNFTFVRQVQTNENGRFSVVVPYATSNEVLPADGGTDSGVTATGNYSVIVGNPFAPSQRGFVDVPEPAIYAGSTVPVDLHSIERNRSGMNSTSTQASSSDATTPSNDTHSNSSQSSVQSPKAVADGADRFRLAITHFTNLKG